MEKAKILMLCSHKDTPRIQRLMDKLKELGIHAELPKDSLVSEKPFAEQIVSLIANTKIIVFFISEHSINSEYLTKEIFFAYECAKTRDKKIIPIVEWENLTLKNTTLEFLLASQQILYPEDGLHSSQDYIDVAARIYEICSNSEGKELLYEKITNLSRIKYTPGISSNLSDLILLLCCEIEQDRNAQSRRSSYKELLRCMEQLQSCGESGYSTEDRIFAMIGSDQMLGGMSYESACTHQRGRHPHTDRSGAPYRHGKAGRRVCRCLRGTRRSRIHRRNA